MAKLTVKNTGSKSLSGLVTVESLTQMGVNNPVAVDNFITSQYRSYYGGGSIEDAISMGGNKRVVSKEEDGIFRWKLQGAAAQWSNLEECLIDGVAIDANSKVGLGLSRFQLVFPDMYFGDVDLIVGTKGSRAGQVRIVGEPEPYGTSWLYNCELITGSREFYMTPDNFESGSKFSKEYPLVEKTLSKKGAGFNYSTSYSLENTFSKIRFQETVPGNVFGRGSKGITWSVKSIGTDGSEKTFNVWDSYKDWEHKMQMKAAKDKMIRYSRSNIDENGNVLNKGLSGFNLDQGAGLEEQLEQGNWNWYNEFDLEEFINALYDLSDNTKGFDEKRKIVVSTGKFGYKYAMELIALKANGISNLRIADGAMKGSGGGRKLDINYTSVLMPDGGDVTFVVDPALDSTQDARNSIMMSEMTPGLPGPANSYTYQVMNVGSKGGESNVEMVYVDTESDIFKVVTGMRSPYESVTGISMSDTIDGYSQHYMSSECMVVIRDTSRTLTFKPQILQG